MADDNNNDQSADDAQGQSATGSKFATSKKSAASRFEKLIEGLPAPNEGENEFYYRGRKMVEDYRESKSRPPEESEGRFLPNVKEALPDVKSIINSIPGPEQPEVETKGATKNIKKNTPTP